MMDIIIDILNNNLDVLVSILGLILSALATVGLRWYSNKRVNKAKIKNNSGNSIVGDGGHIGDKVINNNGLSYMPEVSMRLHGNPASTDSRAMNWFKNSTGQQLVLVSVDINGSVTTYNRAMRNLTYLDDIVWPSGIFNQQAGIILAKARYRTLDNQYWEYLTDGTQQSRADGRFNIIFGNPRIQQVLTDKEEEIWSGAKSGRLAHLLKVAQYPAGFVSIGDKKYLFKDNQSKTDGYRYALEKLVRKGIMANKSGSLYVLSGKR